MDSVLVVVAHPDDECIGAGGTIKKHCDAGNPVDIHCMTGNETRNAEMQEASSILGARNLYLSERDDFAIDESLRNEVVGAILKTRPKIVITHSFDDYNVNHQQCAKVVFDAVEWASHVTVFENAHRVEKIYNMEINTLISHPHVYVDISDTYQSSLNALQAHKSQTSKANNFYEKLYDTRTRLRGVQAGCERAEAFSITMPEHAGPFYRENSVTSLI